MAGNFTFHNKFHRANHHTLSSFDIVDSGLDPIASKAYPFLGVFYNRLTDQSRSFNIDTNSLEWWSAFTTMVAYSGIWMPTLTLYTTVSTLSDSWNLGYSGYTTLKSNSASYDSVYATVCSFSADWGSPFLMFTNKVQEYTHAKTFSGRELVLNTNFVGNSTYEWNLDEQQVAFLTVKKNILIKNPIPGTMITGGLYTLVIKQNNLPVANVGYDVQFEPAYRFNERFTEAAGLNIVNKALSGITVYNFVAVGDFLFGDVTYLSGNY